MFVWSSWRCVWVCVSPGAAKGRSGAAHRSRRQLTVAVAVAVACDGGGNAWWWAMERATWGPSLDTELARWARAPVTDGSGHDWCDVHNASVRWPPRPLVVPVRARIAQRQGEETSGGRVEALGGRAQRRQPCPPLRLRATGQSALRSPAVHTGVSRPRGHTSTLHTGYAPRSVFFGHISLFVRNIHSDTVYMNLNITNNAAYCLYYD